MRFTLYDYRHSSAQAIRQCYSPIVVGENPECIKKTSVNSGAETTVFSCAFKLKVTTTFKQFLF